MDAVPSSIHSLRRREQRFDGNGDGDGKMATGLDAEATGSDTCMAVNSRDLEDWIVTCVCVCSVCAVFICYMYLSLTL
jgi:hypothetical protein